jgi:hypothetical protein
LCKAIRRASRLFLIAGRPSSGSVADLSATGAASQAVPHRSSLCAVFRTRTPKALPSCDGTRDHQPPRLHARNSLFEFKLRFPPRRGREALVSFRGELSGATGRAGTAGERLRGPKQRRRAES